MSEAIILHETHCNLKSGPGLSKHLLIREGVRFPQNTVGSRSGLVGEVGAQCRQRERERDREMGNSENSLVRSVAGLGRGWTTLGLYSWPILHVPVI